VVPKWILSNKKISVRKRLFTTIGGGTLMPKDAAASPQISKSTLIFSYFIHNEPPKK